MTASKSFLPALQLKEAAMPMKPHKGESQSDFMSRCVPEAIGTGEDKRPQEQAVAICYDYWRQEHGGSKAKAADDNGNGCPEVEDDESHAEYMDRCTEDNDEDECQMKWEESRNVKGLILKTHAENVQGMEFVLSDDSIDRMGDTIDPLGWELESFKKNPIALFNHNPNFVIGRWQGLNNDKTGLRGRLVMAPEGTSNRIDEIRKLIDAGIL